MILVNYILFSLIFIILNLVFGECEIVTTEPAWIVQRYFAQKMKLKTTQASTLEPKLNEKSTSPVKFHSKMYIGIFHAKFGFRDQYMAQLHCESNDDCAAGIRMICEHKKCTCRHGELFIDYRNFGCFVKAHMFEKCEVAGQCLAMNPNTYCNPDNGRCTCSPNYVFNGHECRLLYDSSNLKAQEVYKAAVVAAACFIVAVVGIFVACIVRRSFCRREQLQQSESNRSSDIFSISDEIAALRAVDKPPSYEEVLQIERTIYTLMNKMQDNNDNILCMVLTKQIWEIFLPEKANEEILARKMSIQFYGIPPPEYSGPRTEASPSTLTAPLSISSGVPDVNPTGNIECQPAAVASSSRSSSFSENMKDIADNLNFGKNISDNPHTSDVSDFITSAEILPVPSNTENSHVIPSSLVETPSQTVYSFSHSSTPPVLRHNHHCVKTEYTSSSLPSSPYLSSISSKVDVALMNLEAASKKKELEQESEINEQESSHVSENSLLSPSETASTLSMSVPHDSSTNNNTSECSHSVTVIAYDNLGFESDLYF